MKRISLLTLFLLLTTVVNAAKESCLNGKTESGYSCSNIDLMSVNDYRGKGHRATRGNDIWGWTDPETKREYAIMGYNSKTSFIDITDPENPLHLGDLKTKSYNSSWRDIKVLGHYALVVSETWFHGMQIFDLHQLRDVNVLETPKRFQATAQYKGFGNAHNIVVNEGAQFAYAVGTNTCDAGIHVVDMIDPLNPVFLTCIDKDIFEKASLAKQEVKILHGEDYTHDAQCVNYEGPDERYQGKEICFCSNADTVNLVDLTDKTNPYQISVKSYEGLGYTHQGWLTEDHRYFLLGDELDEQRQGIKTRTLIWDMLDLENPVLIGEYEAETQAIDHNMYVKGNYVYQANYTAGLRVLSLENVSEGKLEESAFFDTFPGSDDASFKGSWSVYPYFESGNVIVSNIEGELFILRPNLLMEDSKSLKNKQDK